MISAPSVQRRLPISVEIIAPLKTIDAARSDLATDEDDIVHLIRDRQILAFDLRAEGSQRSEIRIYPPSVDEVRIARKFGILNNPKFDLDTIIPKIISSSRHNIPLSMLRRRLVVSSKHVHHLLEQRLMQAVPGTGDQINQAPMIVRSSIVDFLKSRRIDQWL